MRFHRLDLNLLVALDAILTEKNVTRAAEKLHVSQSAASGLLARLRDYFEDDLLVQTGRRMILTPLAHSLETPLKRILLDIQTNIVNSGEFDPTTSSRHFKVMASDYVSSVFLAPLLRTVQCQAPKMTFDFIPSNNQYEEALKQGEIDFLIQPDLYMSNHHPKAWLFDDTYCCVVWRDNPLLKGKKKMDRELYLSLGHLVIHLGNKRTPSFEEEFAQQFAKDRRIEVSTSHFNTLPLLLVGTNRIGVMQRRLAELYAQTFPINIFEPPETMPRLNEYIQWNQILESDPAHAWLRAICVSVL
jgi:DNA-binding transcriptional LysR family regulator